MRISNGTTMLSAVALVSGFAIAAQTSLAGEQADLPHAFDAGWEGEKTCELLFTDETMRVARCVFPPGTGHEKHYHNPHFGYVLEGGTVRIVDSKGKREVSTLAGGDWSTATVTEHEVLNTGDTRTSYLIVEPINQ